eukprot:scaffold9209_cov157-Amphora_coffeaeformis.AAC.3
MNRIAVISGLLPLLLLATAPSAVAWTSPSPFRNPKIIDDRRRLRLVPPHDDWKTVPQELLLGDDDEPEQDFVMAQQQQQQLPQQYQSGFEKYQFPAQAQRSMENAGQIQPSSNSNDDDDDDDDDDNIDNTPTVQISRTDAGTLELYFGAEGIGSKAVVAGAFSVAWFSALIPATTTVATLPFLLPFYVAGGMVAKQAIVDPFTSLRVSLGEYAWSIHQTRYGAATSKELTSGATVDVTQAVVVDKSRIDPETRILQSRFELQFIFRNGQKPLTIGNVFPDS